jgi:hypothetical protein
MGLLQGSAAAELAIKPCSGHGQPAFGTPVALFNDLAKPCGTFSDS